MVVIPLAALLYFISQSKVELKLMIHLQLANAEWQTRLATGLKYVFGFEVAQCVCI